MVRLTFFLVLSVFLKQFGDIVLIYCQQLYLLLAQMSFFGLSVPVSAQYEKQIKSKYYYENNFKYYKPPKRALGIWLIFIDIELPSKIWERGRSKKIGLKRLFMLHSCCFSARLEKGARKNKTKVCLLKSFYLS